MQTRRDGKTDDYLPSRLCWKIKGVDLSTDAMRAELASKPSADAAALIPELGDDRFEAREKAMEKIRAIGPDAIPALRMALESESAEMRRTFWDCFPPGNRSSRRTPVPRWPPSGARTPRLPPPRRGRFARTWP